MFVIEQILTTDRMLPMQTVQDAHMVFITAVAFAPTSNKKSNISFVISRIKGWYCSMDRSC